MVGQREKNALLKVEFERINDYESNESHSYVS